MDLFGPDRTGPRSTRRRLAARAAASIGVVAVIAVAGFSWSVHAVGDAPAALIGGVVDGPAVCCRPAVRVDPPRVDPPRPPPHAAVGIVGDSLFVGITDRRSVGDLTLEDTLRSGGSTAWTVALVGMTMPVGRTRIGVNSDLVRASDVIAIGLGTNDIYNSGGMARAAWRANIIGVVTQARSINPDIRIVWVDVVFRSIPDRAAAFNTELDAVALYLGIEVCEWSDIAAANPAWTAGDGIHLTRAGYRARHDVVHQCIVDP